MKAQCDRQENTNRIKVLQGTLYTVGTHAPPGVRLDSFWLMLQVELSSILPLLVI